MASDKITTYGDQSFEGVRLLRGVLRCSTVAPGGAESVRPSHVPAHPPAPVAHDGATFAWIGSFWHWAVTNPVPVALSSLVLVPLISEIGKRWGATVADSMVKPEPRRVRILYGADGRVVREVVIED